MSAATGGAGQLGLDEFGGLLRCPACGAELSAPGDDSDRLSCGGCEAGYRIVTGRPVLLREDNLLFRESDYSAASARPRSPPRLQGMLAGTSINLSRERTIRRLGQELADVPEPTVLVVGGGRQRGEIESLVAPFASPRILYSDVDVGADVEVFCDAHDLPFADSAFDAVITTAVLEHVLYPERVVAEIHRVLRDGGLVHSEVPFMQQVHEGAYDFTRYTLSGHRRLFNGFEELDSGMVAGPGTVMVWSIESLALAFVRGSTARNVAKASVRLLFGWIKHLDRLLEHRPAAMDGASCTHFLGRKASGRVPDDEIISGYSGAQSTSHA